MAKKDATAAANSEQDTATENAHAENQAVFGNVTDETKLGLTDDELAALTDGEGDAEGDEAGEADEAEDGIAEGEADADADAEGEAGEGDEAEAGADEGDEGEGEGEGEGTEAADADAGDEATAVDDEDEDDDSPAIPDWKMPEDAKGLTEVLAAEATRIDEAFDNGELTAVEYRQQSKKVSDDQTDLQKQIDRAQMAFEMRQSHFVNVSVKNFLKENEKFSPKNPIMYNALDAEVRRLQAQTDNPFSAKLLKQAKDNITVAMGGVVTKPKPGKGNQRQKAPKPDGVGRKPQTPQTLARTPAADVDDVSGGKYARLERLANTNPDAYQNALEKMKKQSPAEYAAYMSAA
jgi:hypothetical protein